MKRELLAVLHLYEMVGARAHTHTRTRAHKNNTHTHTKGATLRNLPEVVNVCHI
jgi:hypothetical protein